MGPSIHHIAIVVHDLDAALAFYRDALGLETTEQDVLRFAAAWLDKEKKYRARAA